MKIDSRNALVLIHLKYFFVVTCTLFFGSVASASQNEALVILSHVDPAVGSANLQQRFEMTNSNLSVIEIHFSNIQSLREQTLAALKDIDVIRGLVVATHGGVNGELQGFGSGVTDEGISNDLMNATELLKPKLDPAAKVLIYSCSTFCGLPKRTEAQAQNIIDWLGNFDGEIVGSTKILNFNRDYMEPQQIFLDNKVIKYKNEAMIQNELSFRKALKPITIALGLAASYMLVKLGLDPNMKDLIPFLGLVAVASTEFVMLKKMKPKLMEANELISFKFKSGKLQYKEIIYPAEDQSSIIQFRSCKSVINGAGD